MTTRVRIIRPCPPIMAANDESVDASIGDIVDVKDHTATVLIVNGYAEPVGDDE